jgi:predicted nucleic acid-binding protein
MRCLMDTCVFSELLKPKTHPAVQNWIDRQLTEDVFVSVITFGEIRKGIARLSDTAKARMLEDRLFLVRQEFEEQILGLELAELVRWGWLCGTSEKKRITLPVLDSLIAATALQHGLIVATRNVKDFERCGVGVVNPWEAGA